MVLTGKAASLMSGNQIEQKKEEVRELEILATKEQFIKGKKYIEFTW